MSRADYASLATVAERMKLRALADFAHVYRRDAALSAEIIGLSDRLTLETDGATPGDISAALALQRYASVAARRSDHLLAERRALTPELAAARALAMRACGRLDALEILASRQRQEERQRQARQVERMMSGF